MSELELTIEQNGGLSNWLPFRNDCTFEYNFAFRRICSQWLEKHWPSFISRNRFNIHIGVVDLQGRQGLMITQRYPQDYDAIIVGYAASNETGIGVIYFPWLTRTSAYPNGTFILTMADSISVHVGTVEAYDVNDGLL
jgi:hypothetical protein